MPVMLACVCMAGGNGSSKLFIASFNTTKEVYLLLLADKP
jgi:hypothetical protein